MDRISTEDFQLYHDRDSLASAPSHLTSSSPQTLSEESDPFSSPSPTAHHGSPPNEPIFDLPRLASSPDTSPQHSDDDISVLLSDYHHSRPASQQHRPSLQHQTSSPYTPIKMRPSGFRNPSSVRALQDTTPPRYHLTSPLSTSSKHQSGSYFPTPSRKGTPRSQQRSPSKLSPTKKAVAKKEYPLVLLHVTLLPIPTPYSNTIMERVLPPSILANWKLLREKATATVLDRGILIPHPREDYDLLEERLLESLELRMPRILACGHFHLEEDEEAELLAAGEEIDDDGDDVDICTDCGRRVRDGRHGSGTGSRRWNIKLYAANGLMRAAAWGAAWREMERVDVEICPWISEEMKRELEIAKEAEEQDEALRRASEEETTQHLDSEEDIPIDDRPTTSGLDDARMREIYGDSADAYMEGMYPPPSPSPSSKRSPRPQSAQQRPPSELPLSTLLTNYVTLLAHDPRNVAIALLSLLVLLLAIASRSRSSSSIASAVTSPNEYIPPAPPISNYVADSASTISSSLSSIAPSPSVSPVASALHAEESAKRTMESAVQSEDSAAQTAETEHSDDGGSIPDFADQLEARFEFD